MGISSCSSKFVIIVINIFFLLGAALLICAGVQYMRSTDNVLEDVHDYRAAYVAFGIAGLLIVSGIFGAIGAFSEKKVLLGIFAFVVFVTLVLLISASALLFVKHDSAMNASDEYVVDQFNNYGNPNLTVGLELGAGAPDTIAAMMRDVSITSGSASNSTPSITHTTSTSVSAPITKMASTTATAPSATGNDSTAIAPTTTTAAVAATTPSATGDGSTAMAPDTTTVVTTTTAMAPNTTTVITTTTAMAPTTTTVVTTTTAIPGGDTNATDFIDSIQTTFECCGWNNYTDWNTYAYWSGTLGKKDVVPNSCCNHTATTKNRTCPNVLSMKSDRDLIFTNTCKDEVDEAVEFVYAFLSWTAVVFAILVLLGFFGAIFLIRHKRSSDGFNYSSITA